MPTNLIVTCKFHIARYGREEAITKLWPYGQEPDTKACQVDEMAKDVKVQKATVTLARKSGGKRRKIHGLSREVSQAAFSRSNNEL